MQIVDKRVGLCEYCCTKNEQKSGDVRGARILNKNKKQAMHNAVRRVSAYVSLTDERGNTQSLVAMSKSAVEEIRTYYMPDGCLLPDDTFFYANADVIASVLRKGEEAVCRLKPVELLRENFEGQTDFDAAMKEYDVSQGAFKNDLKRIWCCCVVENTRLDFKLIEKSLCLLQSHKIPLTPDIWRTIVFSQAPWNCASVIVLYSQLGVPFNHNYFSAQDRNKLDYLNDVAKDKRLSLQEIEIHLSLTDKNKLAKLAADILFALKRQSVEVLKDLTGVLYFLKKLEVTFPIDCLQKLFIFGDPIHCFLNISLVSELYRVLRRLDRAGLLCSSTIHSFFSANTPTIGNLSLALKLWEEDAGQAISSSLVALLLSMSNPDVAVKAFIEHKLHPTSKKNKAANSVMFIDLKEINVKQLLREEEAFKKAQEEEKRKAAAARAAEAIERERRRQSIVIGANRGSFRFIGNDQSLMTVSEKRRSRLHFKGGSSNVSDEGSVSIEKSPLTPIPPSQKSESFRSSRSVGYFTMNPSQSEASFVSSYGSFEDLSI